MFMPYFMRRRKQHAKLAPDPFKTLGVRPSDDMTTIRLAWRAKVRAHHPDHASDPVVATAELAEINAAFDALQGHVPRKPNVNWPTAMNAAAPKLKRAPTPKPRANPARSETEPKSVVQNEDKKLKRRAEAQAARLRAEARSLRSLANAAYANAKAAISA